MSNEDLQKRCPESDSKPVQTHQEELGVVDMKKKHREYFTESVRVVRRNTEIHQCNPGAI